MSAAPAPEIRYDGVHCALVIQRPATDVVVLRISGTDVGEFGDAPMRGIEECLAGAAPVRLFIDARETRGASIEVSADWARWLGAHRDQLSDIDMLTGSRYVEVTAEFVRRFADLQGKMRIYTDPAAFDAALDSCL
jgi:hypothetical protein